MKGPPADKRYSGFRFLYRALIFRMKAGNAHDIHSPFLFSFYNQVIKGRNVGDEMAIQYRKKLLSDGSLMRFTPSGTSSGKIKELTISEIARTQSASSKKAGLLYRIVQCFKPEIILELGTNLGIGTQYLLLGSKGKVFSIEGSRELYEYVKSKVTQQQSMHLELIFGEFREKLPGVLEQIPSLDFVFFDGDHRQQSTLEYFELCCRKANNNSFFMFDDIHWSPGMEKAWEMIVGDPRISLAIDLYFCGIVFFRKDLSKQFFRLRF